MVTKTAITKADALRVIAAIREQFAGDMTPNSGPMAYEPGFHADGWTVAWEPGFDWALALAPIDGLFVEPVSTWLVAIYPADA